MLLSQTTPLTALFTYQDLTAGFFITIFVTGCLHHEAEKYSAVQAVWFYTTTKRAYCQKAQFWKLGKVHLSHCNCSMSIVYINYLFFPDSYYLTHHFCYPAGFPAVFVLCDRRISPEKASNLFISATLIHSFFSFKTEHFGLVCFNYQCRVNWHQLRTNTLFQIRLLSHNL